MDSISFDRAAEYYDRTRNLTPATMERVVEMLEGELRGRGPCLEIGIGTGRIGLPLAEGGIELAGIDLSLEMLTVLKRKAPVDVPVAVADATVLPFPRGVFGAALACHVLHLIPRWRDAVTELVRVVRPGGLVLIDLGGWSGGVSESIEKRFVLEAGIENARPGATDPAELDAAFASCGGRLRLLPELTDTRTISYDEAIQRMADGLYSFTWSADEDTRRRAADAVREWARAELGPLDEPRERTWTVRWRAYDLPG